MYRELRYINYSTVQLCQDIRRMQDENKITDYAMNGDIEIEKHGDIYKIKFLYDDNSLFEFDSLVSGKTLINEMIAFLNGYNTAVCRQII